MSEIPFKPKSSSISQNNTYDDCVRKWGFSSIDYLPQTPNISTSKGSALHDQIEIFLDVDENGMSNITGKEPKMFPAGWELQYDFFKKNIIFKLNSEEQSMIKRAIQLGIDQSVIVPQPDSVVEFEKKVPINEHLYFTLKIDYAHGFDIEDHKSCSSFDWTTNEDEKSDKYVGKDKQLRCYAYWWAKEYSKESGLPIPERINVCHNQFMINPKKNGPKVRKVQGSVLFSDCEKTWNEAYATALKQLDYRLKIHSGELKTARLPRDISACGKYMGCPYKTVCMAQESPDSYKRRTNLKIKELTLKIEKEIGIMGFNMSAGATSEQAAVLTEIEEEQGNTAPEEKVTEPVKTETKPSTDKVVEKVTEPPTTEVTTRTAKEIKEEIQKITDMLVGAGMEDDVKVSPKILKLKEELKPIEAAEKKVRVEAAAKKKAEKEAEAKAKADAEAEVVAQEKAAFLAQSDEEKNAQISAKLDAAKEKEEKAKVILDDAHKIVAPIKSRSKEVTILINCAQIQGTAHNSLSIQEVFAFKSAQMAKDAGVESYFDLDTWKRRDQFYKNQQDIVDELRGFTVHARVCGGDEQALLNAIMGGKGVRVFGAA